MKVQKTVLYQGNLTTKTCYIECLWSKIVAWKVCTTDGDWWVNTQPRETTQHWQKKGGWTSASGKHQGCSSWAQQKPNKCLWTGSEKTQTPRARCETSCWQKKWLGWTFRACHSTQETLVQEKKLLCQIATVEAHMIICRPGSVLSEALSLAAASP